MTSTIAMIDTSGHEICPMIWKVYILRCSDGKYYVGCTSNLQQRLKAHDQGRVKFTSTRLPIELIVSIAFSNRHRAYRFEKYLKSGSSKAFAYRHLY